MSEHSGEKIVFVEKNEGKLSVKRELFEWAEAAIFAVVFVILVFTFVFRIVGVVGQSMENTLSNADRLIISDLFYTPERGDIIVSNQPWERDEAIIKRVIATEGDTIDYDYDQGIVYLKKAGEKAFTALNEPYIKEVMTEPVYQTLSFPLTVEAGKVFAMGDNRNNSMDSRSTAIGQIDTRYILGKVICRIYPLSELGKVD